MTKTITEFVLDGYGQGETDFKTRLTADMDVAYVSFDTQILQPLAQVLGDPNQAAVLTIAGHSDLAGSGDEAARRQQELDASVNRMQSAVDGMEELLAETAPGYVAGSSDSNPQIAIYGRASGAALLAEPNRIDEAHMSKNRRVQLRLTRFNVG
jgi:hypothetical protein